MKPATCPAVLRTLTRSRCSAGKLLAVLCLCVLALFLSHHSQITAKVHVPLSLPSLWDSSHSLPEMTPSTLVTSPSPACRDVLHNMLRGRWVQRNMTSAEVERMRVFHKRVREEEHHIPKGIQRPDLRCGNLNVGVGGMLHFFKALCDVEGPTPCCYDFKCVSKSIAECKCPNCQDMRTPIHAEYSSWQPVDPACKPRSWTQEEMCRLLKNSTIHFIGDSLVRHVFTAFLLAVRGNFESGAFRATIPQKLRSFCSGLYMFSEKVCRLWLNENTVVCNGTVILKNYHYIFAKQAKEIKYAVMDLVNKTRSFVFLGVGFHDKFDTNLIREQILRPILEPLKTSEWPRLVWANVHQFGMMRTPLTRENNQAVMTFNHNIKDFLDTYNVSVFDTYHFPENVMSFDGQHYGYGVNSMKVNILLHYIEELQSLGKW